MPGTNLPGGVKAVQGWAQWAGPDVTQKSNELDVWVVGDDGKVYHWWLLMSTGKWYGWEAFG